MYTVWQDLSRYTIAVLSTVIRLDHAHTDQLTSPCSSQRTILHVLEKENISFYPSSV